MLCYAMLCYAMKERAELAAHAARLLRGAAPDYAALNATKARYDAMRSAIIAPTAEQAETERALRELHEATVGALDRVAAEALKLLDRAAMEAAAGEAAQHGYTSADLYDIGEKLTLSEKDFIQAPT